MKKSLLSCIIIASIAGFTHAALANENPLPLATDPRMKIVQYNPEDVVTIVGSHLITTDVEFGVDEHILSVMVGDSLAWTPSVSKDIPYLLSIKPVMPSSDTNMTVVTDKRVYHFRLVTTQYDLPQSKNVTYSLTFKYPEEEKAQLTQELNSVSQTFTGSAATQALTWNDNYAFVGSKMLAPIKAVDNGTFTIFEFPKNCVIPAIFGVDASQNESLLNYHVQGNYVFIQGIRHQYTFRNGNEVTTVYNNSFNIS